jgi:DNA ligase-1
MSTPFLELVDISTRTAATSRKTSKLALLADYLRALPPDDVEIAVAFLTGQPRQGRLGAGFASLAAALDRPAASAPSLTLADVDRAFANLLEARGSGSAARRASILGDLFSAAVASERDFLGKLIAGELRQGALQGVMTDAVAKASGISQASVRRAAMYEDLWLVARTALEAGDAGLTRFRMETLRPVAPMLAQTSDDVTEVMEEFGEAALEWKLDGARVQAHKKDDQIRIYTRSLNDVTAAVPEIVERVRTLPARELILDGEAIALDAAGTPRPFQITMKRFGRRLDVEALRATLPLSAFFFDLLRIDDDAVADRPARERFAAMADALPADIVIPRMVASEPHAASAFVADALGRGHEGVMAKALDAPYEAGNRGASWRKIKTAHTLDLVVLAAEWGHGRRQGWLSNLHLGARDPEKNSFVMLGKTFKGMTDAMLAWQTEALLSREIGRDDWTVFVRPELVVEVAFNNVQASPHYPGGLALRFARIKRYRSDKTAQDADTIDTVRTIFAGEHRPSP